MLYFNYFTNPCQLDKGRISCIFEQPKTVWQIIKEQKVDMTMPVICLINGAPVLRKDWGNVLESNELISIVSLPLGGKSSNPLKTILTIALIEATVYMALANRYRRRIVTFSTELEGLIPTYGDLITITHDMAHWGSGGEVIAQKGLKLTLSEPVKFIEGVPNILALRGKKRLTWWCL